MSGFDFARALRIGIELFGIAKDLIRAARKKDARRCKEILGESPIDRSLSEAEEHAQRIIRERYGNGGTP